MLEYYLDSRKSLKPLSLVIRLFTPPDFADSFLQLDDNKKHCSTTVLGSAYHDQMLVEMFKKYGKYIEKIHLELNVDDSPSDHYTLLSDDFFDAIFRHCKNLRSFDILNGEIECNNDTRIKDSHDILLECFEDSIQFSKNYVPTRIKKLPVTIPTICNIVQVDFNHLNSYKYVSRKWAAF